MTDHMTVTVPEGTSGNVAIRRFTTGAPSLRSLIREPDRIVPQGTYTGLYRAGKLWMSDTPAERRDHHQALSMATHLNAERVLVNGLGLGMVISGLLHLDEVEHIDVVEIDRDVIDLVGDHCIDMANQLGKCVEIYENDAYTIKWPAGTRWDIAWSDIWLAACIDNLVDMARLTRKYSKLVRWHGHWRRKELLIEASEERRRENHRVRMYGS